MKSLLGIETEFTMALVEKITGSKIMKSLLGIETEDI